MEMSPELLDRPAHLFLDAPYAQPGLLGYLCITIAVETTCEENLSPKRLEPKDGLLDPREPVTGLQGRDRVGVLQSHVLDRNMQVRATASGRPGVVADEVARSLAQIGRGTYDRSRLVRRLPGHAGEDLLDDIFGTVVGCAPRQKSKQAWPFGAVKIAEHVLRRFHPVIAGRKRIAFIKGQARSA
jgi:hypothetical protein